MSRRGTFDYILLETSGLADPGNLAPLFWVDDGLGSTIYLDGIVTLVDAKNILLSLDEKPVVERTGDDSEHGGMHMTTAHLQISHADIIVINKCDSVTPEQLRMVEERVTSINALASIHRTQYSQVPKLESFLLDLHAYDGVDSLDAMSKGHHSHLDPVNSPPSPFPLRAFNLQRSRSRTYCSRARRQSQPSPSPFPPSHPTSSPPSNPGSAPSSGTPPSRNNHPPATIPPRWNLLRSRSTDSKAASSPPPARSRWFRASGMSLRLWSWSEGRAVTGRVSAWARRGN